MNYECEPRMYKVDTSVYFYTHAEKLVFLLGKCGLWIRRRIKGTQ
jgi:hypothetical protein